MLSKFLRANSLLSTKTEHCIAQRMQSRRGPPPGFRGRDPHGPPPAGFGGNDPRGPPPGFGGRDPRGPPPGFGGNDPRGPPPGFGGRDPRGPPPPQDFNDSEYSSQAPSSPPAPPEPPKRPEGTPKHINVQEREDGVVVLSLNTGKANILHLEAMREFLSWIHYLGNTDGCKGLLLRSDLDNLFCAGFDLKAFLNEATFAEFWSSVQELWMLTTSFPKTLVVEINGHAVGGGCVLALAADYRIMLQGESARIGLPESTFGLTVPPWIISHFCSIVGPRVGERMLQLGEVMDASQAMKIGLVDEVVDSSDALRAAGEAALQRFLCVPEQGKWMTKDMARRELFRFLADEEDRRYDLEFFTKLVQHPDVKSSITKHYESISNKSRDPANSDE